MEQVSLQQIIDACGGRLLWGNADQQISGITIDSRNTAEHTLFIPIAGDKFDGHDFIRAAFDGGAVAALTHRQDTDITLDHTLIYVSDTRKALADIARFYRSLFPIPIIAVTGSVGKTTTKDMLASALATVFRVCKTQGNYNNEIGLPLTIFQMDKSCEIGVLEMGMNHFGEIHNLASIARPDAAVITNIGMSHIENLGSQEGILRAKLEVTDFFEQDDVLFLNGDDPLLWKQRNGQAKTVFFGIDNPACDYRAVDIVTGGQTTSFDAVFAGSRQPITLSLPGRHNVYNALAALAVCQHFGLTAQDCASGLKDFSPSGMRMDIETKNGLTIINDCYNASPASMEAAIDVLVNLNHGRKIAVLGDILEMGAFAEAAHEQIGSLVQAKGVDILICTGENGRYICEGASKAGMDSARVLYGKDNKAVIHELKHMLHAGDTVLIKASRGMRFEQIAAGIWPVDNG